MHHTSLYISFPFLHDYDLKMPHFAFYGGRKQATTNFFFLFLSLNIVPWNSASGGFAYNWQSKWVGIIAMKTERTQIHFLSDVLVAVVSLDLKVPNDTPNTAAMIMERNFWFCFGLSVPWRFFFVWMSVPSKHDIWKKVALGSKMPFYVLYFLLSNLWGCWGSIKIKEAYESTLHNRI